MVGWFASDSAPSEAIIATFAVIVIIIVLWLLVTILGSKVADFVTSSRIARIILGVVPAILGFWLLVQFAEIYLIAFGIIVLGFLLVTLGFKYKWTFIPLIIGVMFLLIITHAFLM